MNNVKLNQQGWPPECVSLTASHKTLFVPSMTRACPLVLLCCTCNAHQFHLSPASDNEWGFCHVYTMKQEEREQKRRRRSSELWWHQVRLISFVCRQVQAVVVLNDLNMFAACWWVGGGGVYIINSSTTNKWTVKINQWNNTVLWWTRARASVPI